jgi:serine/threonine-protein kinase
MKICPKCQRTYPDEFSLCPRDGTALTAQATETEAQLAAGLSRRFRIVRRLGQGGMGAVFLADQITVGNRPVALKVLNRKLLDDPDFLMRFQNEAASTGRIRHSNVVTIYESGQADDGTPYIAMEFLEGESLGEALKRRGALPLPEVAEILQQAARGLNAAHKLGIIHRDLKPDNIFLTRGDEDQLMVKVVDFGIAKLRESSSHTQTGMVLGTPAYMSYEQASGMRSDELDARSDVYSLGVVVYQMLTGRVPFNSDTPVGYLRKHLMDQPPPFRAVAPGLGVPPAVESAVMKALAKDRDQRYASVPDFTRAIMAATLPAPAAEFGQPLPSTKIVPPLAGREPAAPMPRPASAPARADVAVQTPPFVLPEKFRESPGAQPQVDRPIAAPNRPPAVANPPQRRSEPEQSSKMKYVAVVVLAVILVVAGVWYFLPSANPPAVKPQVNSAAPVQQIPVVETPAPTPTSPTGNFPNPADTRKQVEAAKRQGDNYYSNGEYDNAINAYQGGLKLDRSNAQLLQALRRAQTAKAAEEKFNQ